MKSSKTTKVFFSVLAIAVTLGSILVVSGGDSTYAAQRSYPMTCRGGGRLTIANDGNNGVWITFEAGKGAVYEGLEPGQCTWSDRRISDREPRVICDGDNKRAAKYVGSLVRSDGTVIFQVYNYEGRCMRVTKIGP